MYKCNEIRLKDIVESFSQFGATASGEVTRLSLSEEDLQARNYFCDCCKELNMEIKFDDLANIYATLPGKKDFPPIVIGAHLDTVEKGGCFDGVLGISTALEAIRTIQQNDIELDIPLVIVNFTNKEGARFNPAMMSSGVISSKYDKDAMLQSVDKNGVTFKKALSASGYKDDEDNRLKEASVYIELHPEQGPILAKEDIEIGIVEGLLGMVCYEITIIGESKPAWTTPMSVRKDPILVAANLISKLDAKLSGLDQALLYTIGSVNVSPNIPAIIPDKVTFTIDVRHQVPQIIKQVEVVIQSLLKEESVCIVTSSKLWSRDAIVFEPSICNEIEQSCKDYGYSFYHLYSGAGHDAQFIANIVPAAMIFVPDIKDRAEKQIYESYVKGADVLLETILTLQTKLAMKQPFTECAQFVNQGHSVMNSRKL